MYKIGLIVPDENSVKMIRRTYRKEVLDGSIIVELMSPNLDEMRMQAIGMEKAGCQALITRGRSYDIITPAVSMLVLKITFTVNDIIRALSKAESLNKKIALVLSYSNCPELEEIIDGIRYPFALYRYHEDEQELEIVRSLESDVVCIGGYYACKEADSLGLAFVKIETGPSTFSKMIADAQQILDKSAREINNNRLYSAILRTIREGVISFDERGRIMTWNEKAEKYMEISAGESVGKLCEHVVPEFSASYRRFMSQTSPTRELIVRIRGEQFSVRFQRLTEGPDRVPVLCTFQTIEEIADQEKSVRIDLHKKGLVAKFHFDDVIKKDEKFIRVIAQAQKIAGTEGSVLIIGESGTGKEVIAQSIHNASSRAAGPFVAINCGAISESLLESELFGYEEGSFTGARRGGKEGLFEIAHGGTIFLDEINSMPTLMQSKLLRVLQEKEVMRVGGSNVIPVNVRVIAAANEKLYEQIKNQSFRKDLLFRLSTFELVLPPLRERPGDVLALFAQFVKEAGSQGQIRALTKAEEQSLLEYDWPGNARELRNLAERFALDSSVEDVRSLLRRGSDCAPFLEPKIPGVLPASIDLREITRSVEQSVIRMLLERGYSKSDVADMLGISRTSLYHYINAKKS